MPGGLLALVCYGNENIIINGNPQTTFFYKSFQRYVHFSQEPIQISLDGPNQLMMDAPILLKAKIPRQGDLLSDLVLRLTLPAIFSKAYVRTALNAQGQPITDLSGFPTVELDKAYEFQWVRQIGVRMIDSITFTIGGQVIQRFNSDWIAARATLDYDLDTYNKWRVMVGDVPECFDPAQGIYSDPSLPPGQGYPNVIAWRGSQFNPQPTQNNSPSIPERILRIPLGLWFSDFAENGLPLVALQYHDSDITIQMAPIRNLYTILDTSKARVRYGVQTLPPSQTNQYSQIWNETLYGPIPPSMNNLYGTATDMSGSMRYFLTDISGAVPNSDGWPLNATLEGTFTYLQDDVRIMFTSRTLRYNVRQMQYFTFSGVNSRNTYRLDVHNIATRVVFFARRSDSVTYRNQMTNLTNWMYPLGSQRPFVTPALVYTYPNHTFDTIPPYTNAPPPYPIPTSAIQVPLGRSGLNIAGTQRNIITTAFMTANGNSIFDAEDAGYFTQYVPFQYLNGNASPAVDFGLASQTAMWPLFTYSFALNSSQVDQPSGTLNLSRIDRFEMDVDVWPIPYLARYTYTLYAFVETLNFLEITSGLGGMKFAI